MDARLTFLDFTTPMRAPAAASPAGGVALDDAKAVMPSAALAAFTGVVSMIVIWRSGLSKDPVRLAYVGAAVTVLQLVILGWATIEFCRTARAKAENPARVLAARLRDRLLLLSLPTLILPLFLASFTINKTGIAHLVGFRWDSTWANVDAALFGTDVWRITHALIGPLGTRLLEFCYAVAWGLAFAFVAPILALYGSTRAIGRFYLALILTWLIGGNLLAYAFASAGPFLSPDTDPMLALRFQPLRDSLHHILPPSSLIRGTQDYLAASVHDPFVIMGGGISAMPSMHVATVTIYALAARGTRYIVPAGLFAILIFIGSIHFGFHYVCDGMVGTAVAVGCWWVAGLWFARYRDPVRS